MPHNKHPMNESHTHHVTIKVQTANQQYPIHIGQRLDIVGLLADYLCQNGKQPMLHIICDKNVYQHYGQKMEAGLADANISYRLHQVPIRGEKAKSIAIYEQMLETILKSGIDRSHVIAAWGGGVWLAIWQASSLAQSCAGCG